MSVKTIISENRSYWNQRASSYSEVNQMELHTESHLRWQQLLDEKIRSRFPDRSRNEIRVLEVGTGPGFFAILLAELGYDVTAIDLTPNMLTEARRNAGALADRIHFYEMNAEALQFANDSFEVLLSRNLTWNLPHPEQAYREWSRVLCHDGLLLNFDANWYGYLYDEQAKDSYCRDRENAAESGIMDQNVDEGTGVDFSIMEDIARRIPLSGIQRPAWDVDLLTSMGISVCPDEHIWKRVWSDDEKISFASTPLFLIEARNTKTAEAEVA
ncbi:MAG: methyltransferase domain-containing protein [Eubacteriales bacterium]|nr:methyltransferase domain-containing protein [Eubacteriales bacterium]